MKQNFDALFAYFNKISVPLARTALAVVYIWFGLLKVIGQSPASAMVQTLLGRTMPFFSFSTFIIIFGLFEILIGILFVIPKAERVAIILFFIHMITTTLPLFIMGDMVWTGTFIPTLEGQYIIKNLALITCVVVIGGSLSQRHTSGESPRIS